MKRTEIGTPHILGLSVLSGVLLALSYTLRPLWWAAAQRTNLQQCSKGRFEQRSGVAA